MARGKEKSSSGSRSPKKAQSQSEEEGSYSEEYSDDQAEEGEEGSEGAESEEYSDYSYGDDGDAAADEKKDPKKSPARQASPKGRSSKKSASPPPGPVRKVTVVDTPSPERRPRRGRDSDQPEKLPDIKPQAKQTAKFGDKKDGERYGYGQSKDERDRGGGNDRDRRGRSRSLQRQGQRRSRSRSRGRGSGQNEKPGSRNRRDRSSSRGRDRDSKNGVQLEELAPPPRRDDRKRSPAAPAATDIVELKVTLQKLIEDLYRQRKKSLGTREIDALLKKYKNQELEFYNVLCRHYNEKPRNDKLSQAIGNRSLPNLRVTYLRYRDGRHEPVNWDSDVLDSKDRPLQRPRPSRHAESPARQSRRKASPTPSL